MTGPAGIRLDPDGAAVDWVAAKADLAADRFDNGRSPEALARSFASSAHAVYAWDGPQLVGMARLLSDGVSNAYLVDVWTRSSHRHQGIGSAMVRHLVALVPGQHVGLQTDDAADFYRGLGFRPQPEFLSAVSGEWLDNEANRSTGGPATRPPAVGSWISPAAGKGAPSGIEGRGLRALAPIARGEVVAVKGGHLVTDAVYRALNAHLQNSEIQVTDELHLVALREEEYEPVMLFLNHSCEPNVGFAGSVVLVAMRDVDAGEELTTDYALFDSGPETMVCRCGRPGCRRIVTGDDWRLPELQERYRGYFSWYLERRIRSGEARISS